MTIDFFGLLKNFKFSLLIFFHLVILNIRLCYFLDLVLCYMAYFCEFCRQSRFELLVYNTIIEKETVFLNSRCLLSDHTVAWKGALTIFQQTFCIWLFHTCNTKTQQAKIYDFHTDFSHYDSSHYWIYVFFNNLLRVTIWFSPDT